MKTQIYLIINSRGSIRVNKTTPRLEWNEIALPLSLDLPDRLFQKPMLRAEITIPESVIPESPLNASIVDNVKDAIKEATGLVFNIKIEEPKED